MPSQEEIEEQQALLSAHRKTLAILLEQQAHHTKAFTPPSIEHGIREARANIRRVKKTLQDWGVTLAEHPDDKEEAFRPPPSPMPKQNILAWVAGLATIAALFIAFGPWLWQYGLEPKPTQSSQSLAASTAAAAVISMPTDLAVTSSVSIITETPSMGPDTTENQAIATATAAVELNSQLSYGPSSNRLLLSSRYIATDSTSTNLLNFVVSARFHNPYSKSEGGWSYGFRFRDTGTTNYNLIISERPLWVMAIYDKNGKSGDLAGKEVGFTLDTSNSGYNDIALVVIGDVARLFINNKYVDTIDIPEKVVSGKISIIAGIYGAIDGKYVSYENFTIRKLP